MIALAISVLWLLIGIIVLLGVVWLALYIVKLFAQVPAPIEAGRVGNSVDPLFNRGSYPARWR